MAKRNPSKKTFLCLVDQDRSGRYRIQVPPNIPQKCLENAPKVPKKCPPVKQTLFTGANLPNMLPKCPNRAIKVHQNTLNSLSH